MLPAKYKLIGVLCGLIGALASNEKTAQTDAVILDALQLYAQLPENDSPETMQKVKVGVARIRREKFTIVPACAVCQSPCANNADFDMQRILDAPEPERIAKLSILEKLSAIGALLPAPAAEPTEQIEVPLTREQLQLLMQAVSFLAWESDSGYLQAMEQLLFELASSLSASSCSTVGTQNT